MIESVEFVSSVERGGLSGPVTGSERAVLGPPSEIFFIFRRISHACVSAPGKKRLLWRL